MILLAGLLSYVKMGIPRESGDDPYFSAPLEEEVQYSPRERG